MSLRVLIVDDSPAMRSFVRRILDLSGLEVADCYEAGDGQQGLDVLSRHQVDLIFADINMPVMNGEEMVRWMNESGVTASVPVIMVSTDATIARIEHLRALGVRGYLTKPFRPEDLREEVERVLAFTHEAERIKEALDAAAEEVLERMFFTTPETEAPPDKLVTGEGWNVHVAITGDCRGDFQLWADPDPARAIAADFAGALNPDELSDAKVEEVLAELANMICGDAISRLTPNATFSLAQPGVRRLGPADFQETGREVPRNSIVRAFHLGCGTVGVSMKLGNA